MKFRDFERLIREQILGTVAEPSTHPILPGPLDPDKYPGAMLVLQNYGGPGEDVEGLLDDVSWQVRTIGRQSDYYDAENMANAIDIGLLSWRSARMFDGGPWLTGIQRVGGAPSPLQRDNADRVHFVASYILSVELAPAN